MLSRALAALLVLAASEQVEVRGVFSIALNAQSRAKVSSVETQPGVRRGIEPRSSLQKEACVACFWRGRSTIKLTDHQPTLPEPKPRLSHGNRKSV